MDAADRTKEGRIEIRRVLRDGFDAWCACPLVPDDEGFEEWRDGERAWIDRWHRVDPHLYAAVSGDELLGKHDVPFRGARRWGLYAPSVRAGPGAPTVLRALCASIPEEARRRGIARIELILEATHPHHDLARVALLETGFAIEEKKVVVARDLTSELPRAEDVGLGFRPATDTPADELTRLAGDAGMDPWELEELDPAGPSTALGLVLVHEAAPVGVVLVGAPPGEETLTLLHLGLVRTARGRGLGRAILPRLFRHAREHGFVDYVGSTARDNRPMRRLFERAGCETIMERTVFTLAT